VKQQQQPSVIPLSGVGYMDQIRVIGFEREKWFWVPCQISVHSSLS